jgi:hypothetical protein
LLATQDLFWTDFDVPDCFFSSLPERPGLLSIKLTQIFSLGIFPDEGFLHFHTPQYGYISIFAVNYKRKN